MYWFERWVTDESEMQNPFAAFPQKNIMRVVAWRCRRAVCVNQKYRLSYLVTSKLISVGVIGNADAISLFSLQSVGSRTINLGLLLPVGGVSANVNA